MKCERCGRNEVRFHYSSNINGAVTETHLCGECAAESGYDIDYIVRSFELSQKPITIHEDNILPFLTQQPSRMHKRGISANIRRGIDDSPRSRGWAATEVVKKTVEVDENLKQQRELNIKLRLAIENEEFEEAAVLRDMIKELNTL